VIQHDGSFTFDRDTLIEASPDCLNEANFLASMLKTGPGEPTIMASTKRSSDLVVLELDDSRDELGQEGYTLTVTPKTVVITAKKPAGIFYGIESVRQMLPAGIENSNTSSHTRWSIPCAQIKDKPKYAWRGMMLDVSRHFYDKGEVEHILDLLAMQKMNVFHWHLVDDGGWRIEIKKYPRLTSFGAWREWTTYLWDQRKINFPGTTSDTRVYGGFYTQDDIREIVKYAADRHITIVPEIEMPGHSMAACASYPELICTNANPANFLKAAGTPFPNVYCAGKESTFKFIEGVLDEVCDLFPSPYIHIGGDEVDKYLWDHCPDCQRRMKEEGLKNAEELQSYFIRRIEKYLNSKGKRLIGWDEILEGGLAPNAAVMSWRGIQGGIDAAKAGHNVVMSPTSACYFDYSYQSISTETAFNYDPVPSELPADKRPLVLGEQCNLWTERVPDMPTAEERLFPRILGISEGGWSENKDPDFATFEGRMGPFYSRLDAMGVNYHLPEPIAASTALFLNGSVQVGFKQPPMPNAEIRFTVDGSDPNEDSPVYRGPINISKPTIVTASLWHGAAHSGSVHVVVRGFSTPDPSTLVPGLDWYLYQGEFDLVPDYDFPSASKAPKPNASGTTDHIDLVGGLKENYALAFDGFIKIDTEGTYTFFTKSDDGSNLSVGGVEVVANDGPHSSEEKSGTIFLKKGYYPFRVGYFQGGGDQDLSASISGPGIAKMAIPPTMLFRQK
jgi:hexosaminidase